MSKVGNEPKVSPQAAGEGVPEAATAFDSWWATKVAEGYQYGRGPLATVRFGFEAGYATARAYSPTVDVAAEACLMADCDEPQAHFCVTHVLDVHCPRAERLQHLEDQFRVTDSKRVTESCNSHGSNVAVFYCGAECPLCNALDALAASPVTVNEREWNTLGNTPEGEAEAADPEPSQDSPASKTESKKSDVENIIDWLEHRCQYAPPCGKCTYCVIAKTIPWFDSGQRVPESSSSISSTLAEIRECVNTEYVDLRTYRTRLGAALMDLGHLLSIIDSLQAEIEQRKRRFLSKCRELNHLNEDCDKIEAEAASNMKAAILQRVREKAKRCEEAAIGNLAANTWNDRADTLRELATELEAVSLENTQG